MSEKIGKFFIKALRDNTTISSAVSGRIYPVGRPNDAETADEMPYVVVMPMGVKPNQTKDGEYGDSCTVKMFVCAITYESLVDLVVSIRGAVRNACTYVNGWPFEVVGLDYASEAPYVDPDKPCYWQILQWEVETINR